MALQAVVKEEPVSDYEEDEDLQVLAVMLTAVKTEDGMVPVEQLYNIPVPPPNPNDRRLYELGIEPLDELPRIMDRGIDMANYLEQERMEARNGGLERLDDTAKKLLFTLIHNRPALWFARNILVGREEWEAVGWEMARRLGRVHSVSTLRKEWGFVRRKVKERLTRYISRGMNDAQVEAEFFKDPLYIHYRFYRIVLREYEDHLRLKRKSPAPTPPFMQTTQNGNETVLKTIPHFKEDVIYRFLSPPVKPKEVKPLLFIMVDEQTFYCGKCSSYVRCTNSAGKVKLVQGKVINDQGQATDERHFRCNKTSRREKNVRTKNIYVVKKNADHTYLLEKGIKVANQELESYLEQLNGM